MNGQDQSHLLSKRNHDQNVDFSLREGEISGQREKAMNGRRKLNSSGSIFGIARGKSEDVAVRRLFLGGNWSLSGFGINRVVYIHPFDHSQLRRSFSTTMTSTAPLTIAGLMGFHISDTGPQYSACPRITANLVYGEHIICRWGVKELQIFHKNIPSLWKREAGVS